MVRTAGRGKLRTGTCGECGREFQTRGRATRFCSNRCGTIASGRAKRSARGEMTCARCGKVFVGQTKDFATKPRRRYCSAYCYGIAIRKGGATFTCAHCGAVTPFKKLKSGGYWYAQRFCSKRCADDAQRTGSIDKHGYRVFVVNGRQISEHRSVMERVLGRALRPAETIHHKNGLRSDNRPENLELWDSRHPKGSRVADKIAWCIDYLREHGYDTHGWAPPSS